MIRHSEAMLIGLLTPLVLFALFTASVASATPISSAMSLTHNFSSGTCGRAPAFNDATDNWRNAVSANGVALGPNDATIFWSEITDAQERAGGEDHINDNLD